MGDGRRTVCGILFWTKAFIAFCLVCGLLGLQSYQIYNLRKIALANKEKQDNFDKLIGGPDQNHEPKIVISPTNVDCSAETVQIQNITSGGIRRAVTTGGRLEPPQGVKWFGFAIDFSYDTPSLITSRLNGRRPSVIAAFLTIGPDFDVDENMVNWFGQQTGLIGGILELTVVPNVTLDILPQRFYDNMTDICYRVNTRYGVPIMLRYAHEMNGNWSPYGQRPTAFKTSWIRLTNLLRQKTNMTAMMWGPNPGSGYPYGEVTAATNPEFANLDTNRDGILSNADDPYGPYWPGAQYVDWVAISMYNYGFNTTTRQFDPINPAYITQELSGPWPGVPPTPYQDFYSRFVDAFAKPFAFPESGSPFIPGTPGNELENKKAWWTEIMKLFSDGTLYPNLKLVVHFEHSKVEEAIVGYSPVKDFTITNTTAMAAAFVTDITPFERQNGGLLVWANSMNYTCGGKVSVK